MQVSIILVPYDCGYYRKRMGLGPAKILNTGLKPLFARKGILFATEEIILDSEYPTEISAAFQLARKVAERVRACRMHGRFPIVLSGNCNAAIGTVSGCGTQDSGIVWFDAHGEATTPETTVSGFLDGMPLSTILGRAWQTLAKTVPEFSPVAGNRVLLIDGRAADAAEASLLAEQGVQRFAKPEQLRATLVAVAKEVHRFYLHVDLDVLDPAIATANQWTPPGGMTVEDLVGGITTVRNLANIGALGIGSYDPARDQNGRALAAGVAVVEAVLAQPACM